MKVEFGIVHVSATNTWSWVPTKYQSLRSPVLGDGTQKASNHANFGYSHLTHIAVVSFLLPNPSFVVSRDARWKRAQLANGT